MFRVISHVRSQIRTLSQTIIHLPQPFVPSTPVSLIPSNYHPIAYSSLFPLVPILSSPFSHTPLLQKNENPNATGPPKLLVLQPRLRPETLLRVKLNEALNLANSLEELRDDFYETEFSEELPPHLVVQNPALRSIRADTYFGPGTVDTVKCQLNAFESEDERDAVFVNAILTAIQQRNLERAWGKPVLDRVGLIIEIFNAHAQTKEAKLQAELAALMYKKSRLVRVRGPGGRCTFGGTGEAEVVSGRGRGSGGRGFISGAGETELQLQRRRILDRRNRLMSEIKEVRRTRALQRAGRKRHGGAHGQEMATVAVVGYTNAGKSTLVSALSDSYLYCDDRLFATVDPKLRSIVLPSGRKVILSDTVGFISDLPVQLVEAFHATLEEVIEADLLVHVLDSSAPNPDEHRETVLQVLEQIGVSEDKLQNMVEVWNKIDLQEEDMGCYGEGEAACHLASHDDDIASELSSEEHMDENNNNDDKFMTELASEEAEGIIDDQQGDYSDGWLSSEDEQGIRDVPDNSSVGCETPDDGRRNSKNRRIVGRHSYSGEESIPHVKTSAVTGIGLQELLELIDDRLKTCQIQEQDIFDRKWRPPRAEDTSLAVEE